jgi:hypothetical protein
VNGGATRPLIDGVVTRPGSALLLLSAGDKADDVVVRVASSDTFVDIGTPEALRAYLGGTDS